MSGTLLPKAAINPKQKQATLVPFAQNIHNSIAADPTNFPVIDLPITLTALQTLIDNYQTTTPVSKNKGSKAQTTAKNTAKKNLQNALRELATYVSQVALASITTPSQNPADYAAAQLIINKSGFKTFINPSKPVQANPGLTIPVIRKFSYVGGVFKLLLAQYSAPKRGKVFFLVNYRTSAVGVTPAGPWIGNTFTSQKNIIINSGFTQGVSYDWQVAAVGRRNVNLNQQKDLNFTNIQTFIMA